MSDTEASILSHEEREIARRLREGQSAAEIAEARNASVESVEKAADRVREKTDRAVATLLQSPYAAEAIGDRSEADRFRLAALVGGE